MATQLHKSTLDELLNPSPLPFSPFRRFDGVSRVTLRDGNGKEKGVSRSNVGGGSGLKHELRFDEPEVTVQEEGAGEGEVRQSVRGDQKAEEEETTPAPNKIESIARRWRRNAYPSPLPQPQATPTPAPNLVSSATYSPISSTLTASPLSVPIPKPASPPNSSPTPTPLPLSYSPLPATQLNTIGLPPVQKRLFSTTSSSRSEKLQGSISILPSSEVLLDLRPSRGCCILIDSVGSPISIFVLPPPTSSHAPLVLLHPTRVYSKKDLPKKYESSYKLAEDFVERSRKRKRGEIIFWTDGDGVVGRTKEVIQGENEFEIFFLSKRRTIKVDDDSVALVPHSQSTSKPRRLRLPLPLPPLATLNLSALEQHMLSYALTRQRVLSKIWGVAHLSPSSDQLPPNDVERRCLPGAGWIERHSGSAGGEHEFYTILFCDGVSFDMEGSEEACRVRWECEWYDLLKVPLRVKARLGLAQEMMNMF